MSRISTADLLGCMPDHALERILADIRRIDEPAARAVERDVERMIEQRLAERPSRKPRRSPPNLTPGARR